MKFPLEKKILINNTERNFLESYKDFTEIPLLPHPGAFSKIRRFHQHEGIDLYCEEGDKVISIEDGEIIDIFPFTGEHVGTDWWNNTWGVLIEGELGVFNYGEIIPNPNLKIGDEVKEGQEIGKVTTVLKKDKGRPMTMLHLEQYRKGTKKAISGWHLNTEKPYELLDPTQILLAIYEK